jgi:hypothetical protein
MKKMRQSVARTWAIMIWIAAVLLVLITFSPLVLNPGRTNPRVLSLPFTLWSGMLTTLLLVLLAYLSSRIRDKL